MRLRIPSALPYFFGGLRIASGLALIGAVVAEFVAGTGGQGAGLAYQILLAGIQLNIPRLFAALVLIALAGVALFAATVWRRAARAVPLARERARARRLTEVRAPAATDRRPGRRLPVCASSRECATASAIITVFSCRTAAFRASTFAARSRSFE